MPVWSDAAIGSLGTIAMPSSVAAGIAFWNWLHEQLSAGSAASDDLSKSSLHAYLGNVVESKEETMSREQSLRNGAGLMVLGALIFLVYAVMFFLRAFPSS
jgi:hypothetical protein